MKSHWHAHLLPSPFSLPPLTSYLKKMKIEKDFSLLPFNTFGLDVRARAFIEYASKAELLSVLPLAGEHLCIGRGSNLLFTADYAGTVLHSAILGKEIVAEEGDDVLVRVGSGELWDDFVQWALSQGLSGVENLSLIPGEVGAAAVQNIGAYGAEVADVIERVEAIELSTGHGRTFTNADCHYAYRHSIFKTELRGQLAITHVVFRLSRIFRPRLNYGGLAQAVGATPTPSDVRAAVVSIRKSKLPDPSEQGNAGSFFMNPVLSEEAFKRLQAQWPSVPHYRQEGGVKVPAGWLIEQCGWKGKALGRAGVSERQALVLVNLGGATGKDIIRLAEAVIADVKEKFGIALRPEVNVF